MTPILADALSHVEWFLWHGSSSTEVRVPGVEYRLRLLRPDVAQRLPHGQRREALPVLGHEGAYGVRVGLGVLAQAPADGLADEEVAAGPTGAGSSRRGGRCRCVPLAQLVEQGRADRLARSSSALQASMSAVRRRGRPRRPSDDVRGKQVDGVPPRHRGEQMLDHGQDTGKYASHTGAGDRRRSSGTRAGHAASSAARPRRSPTRPGGQQTFQDGAGQAGGEQEVRPRKGATSFMYAPQGHGPLGIGRGGVHDGEPLQPRCRRAGLRGTSGIPLAVTPRETHHTAITHICRLVSHRMFDATTRSGGTATVSPRTAATELAVATAGPGRSPAAPAGFAARGDEESCSLRGPATPCSSPCRASRPRDRRSAVPAAAVADQRLAAATRGAAAGRGRGGVRALHRRLRAASAAEPGRGCPVRFAAWASPRRSRGRCSAPESPSASAGCWARSAAPAAAGASG